MNAMTDTLKPATVAKSTMTTIPTAHLNLPNDRWKPLEIVFWLLPIAAYFAFPGYLVLISQIMIWDCTQL